MPRGHAVAGLNFHGREPSACISVAGKLLAFAEEDRFTREKGAEDRLPFEALQFCLRKAGIHPREIACFTFPWDGPSYADGRVERFYNLMNSEYPPDDTMLRWQAANLQRYNPDSMHSQFTALWRSVAGSDPVPRMEYVPHHYAHACGTFFASGYEEALIFVLDGNGDVECTSVWQGTPGDVECLASIDMPHSLGWFYSTITNYLGYTAGEGEAKVMGLAAYGAQSDDMDAKMARILRWSHDGWGYEVDHRYLFSGAHNYSTEFTDELVELLGFHPRSYGDELTLEHKNLAFAAQARLESTVVRMVSWWREKCGFHHLCLNGGVAMNCKMNGEILRQCGFDSVYVPPAASDAGQSIGATSAYLWEHDRLRSLPISSVAFGPEFRDEEIEDALRVSGYAFHRELDLPGTVATALTRGEIVGWFQGRLELGARALGSRSILADPRVADVRDQINREVKHRESWRPLCPSILDECAEEILGTSAPAPFMNMAFQVSGGQRAVLPAVVHVDGTTRPQVVSRRDQPLFWETIARFRELTGTGAVLNTSFNDDEPIVCSPRDAVRCFASTGLDAMAIGPYFVSKRTDVSRESANPKQPEMIAIPAGQYPIGKERSLRSIEAFAIARTPVTNSEYAAFLEWLTTRSDESIKHPLQPAGKCHVPQYWREAAWNQPDHPVVGIDYWDAHAYAQWIGMRLPTEWEWEAAAGGTEGLLYPWGNSWRPRLCNSAELHGKNPWRDGRTTPVDAFPSGASPFGVLDMAGNVWEWIANAFVRFPKNGHMPQFEGNGCVSLRGGSFRRSKFYQYCSIRCDAEVDCRGSNNGFRLCANA